MKSIAYRSDIDGLRAVAVLSVLVYHINKGIVPGGFVGVDVFFVISGFLITGIISREISNGKFSFVDFYVRRIKRILPATTFVILATLVAGTAILLPDDIQSLAHSSLASLFSAANIYFWLFLDTGYFADSSDLVPLLHMWSLGVEEQFYLIWPLMLFGLSFILGRKSIIAFTMIFAVLLFCYSQSVLQKDPLFSYYMLPSRAGELLVGAVVYFMSDYKLRKFPALMFELASCMGAGLLGASLFLISSNNKFPGLLSVFPTLGAALVIWAGGYRSNLVNKILSNSIFVTVGLYSFSLYLWHWPVLALYRYAFGEPDASGVMICLFIIAAGTFMSYKFIEQPFRHGFTWKRIDWKPALTVAVAMVVGISYVAHQRDGHIGFLVLNGKSEELQRLDEITKPAPQFNYVCQSPKVETQLLKDSRCVIGNMKPDQSPNILVFGDSNASHYMGYLKLISESLHLNVRNVAQSACVPLVENSSRYVSVRPKLCDEFNLMMAEEFKKYDMVIIGAAWNSYRGDGFYEDVRQTIKFLSEAVDDVVIALKIPVIGNYDRQCLQKALLIPGLDCMANGTVMMRDDYAVNKFLISLAEEMENVSVLSVRDYLCKGDICSAYIDGLPVYYNPSHLSLYGSELIGSRAVTDNNIHPVFHKYARGAF